MSSVIKAAGGDGGRIMEAVMVGYWLVLVVRGIFFFPQW